MTEREQIDIKQVAGDKFTLSFPYHAEFIEWLKQRIPHTDRSYDPDTHTWTVGAQYLAAIEGIAVQKFTHAVKWFDRDSQRVWKNLKTGVEQIQGTLF